MEERIPIRVDEVLGALKKIGIGKPVKPKESLLQMLDITKAESELPSIDPPSLEMLCYLWLSETSLGIPFKWEVVGELRANDQRNKQFWLSRCPEIQSEIQSEIMLKQRVIDSCGVLSSALCDNAYLLDKLYTKEEGYAYPSYLDAELFGVSVVIYKLFDRYDAYCRDIWQTLKTNVVVWAYTERLFCQIIGSLSYERELFILHASL